MCCACGQITSNAIHYRIAGNVGGVKLWQNHSSRAFGRAKLGELTKFSITF